MDSKKDENNTVEIENKQNFIYRKKSKGDFLDTIINKLEWMRLFPLKAKQHSFLEKTLKYIKLKERLAKNEIKGIQNLQEKIFRQLLFKKK